MGWHHNVPHRQFPRRRPVGAKHTQGNGFTFIHLAHFIFAQERHDAVQFLTGNGLAHFFAEINGRPPFHALNLMHKAFKA